MRRDLIKNLLVYTLFMYKLSFSYSSELIFFESRVLVFKNLDSLSLFLNSFLKTPDITIEFIHITKTN